MEKEERSKLLSLVKKARDEVWDDEKIELELYRFKDSVIESIEKILKPILEES